MNTQTHTTLQSNDAHLIFLFHFDLTVGCNSNAEKFHVSEISGQCVRAPGAEITP